MAPSALVLPETIEKIGDGATALATWSATFAFAVLGVGCRRPGRRRIVRITARVAQPRSRQEAVQQRRRKEREARLDEDKFLQMSVGVQGDRDGMKFWKWERRGRRSRERAKLVSVTEKNLKAMDERDAELWALSKRPYKGGGGGTIGGVSRRQARSDLRPDAPALGDAPVWLSKFLSHCGTCSRRDVEALVLQGRVRINGEVARNVVVKVSPTIDFVEVDGKRQNPRTLEELVWVAVHKPKDCLSTMEDPGGRRCIVDLVPFAKERRLTSVGRLDRNSTGIIVLTNDLEWCDILTHPRHGHKKRYTVQIYNGIPDKKKLEALERGLVLPDEDRPLLPITELEVKGEDAKYDVAILSFVLSEGRYRQIRRMFEYLGHPCKAIKRTQFGPIKLGGLLRGEWRQCTPKEVRQLKANPTFQREQRDDDRENVKDELHEWKNRRKAKKRAAKAKGLRRDDGQVSSVSPGRGFNSWGADDGDQRRGRKSRLGDDEWKSWDAEEDEPDDGVSDVGRWLKRPREDQVDDEDSGPPHQYVDLDGATMVGAFGAWGSDDTENDRTGKRPPRRRERNGTSMLGKLTQRLMKGENDTIRFSDPSGMDGGPGPPPSFAVPRDRQHRRRRRGMRDSPSADEDIDRESGGRMRRTASQDGRQTRMRVVEDPAVVAEETTAGSANRAIFGAVSVRSSRQAALDEPKPDEPKPDEPA